MNDPDPYIRREEQKGLSTYRAIDGFDVSMYSCGLNAGDEIQLKQDLVILDCHGKPSGEVYEAGGVWEVLRGSQDDPGIVWLRTSKDDLHTWSDDETIWEVFERRGFEKRAVGGDGKQ